MQYQKPYRETPRWGNLANRYSLAVPFDETEYLLLTHKRKTSEIRITELLSPLLCDVDEVALNTYEFTHVASVGKSLPQMFEPRFEIKD